MASEGFDNSGVVKLQSATIAKIREIQVNRKSKYMFVMEVKWSNGLLSKIWRSYNDFFEFQCRLLDSFPEEAGCTKDSKRTIPFLPGKKVFSKSDMKLAEQRRPSIEKYLQELLEQPDKISQNALVVSFFEKWASDPHSYSHHPSQMHEAELQSSSESLLNDDSAILLKPRMKQAYDNTSFDGSLDSLPDVTCI